MDYKELCISGAGFLCGVYSFLIAATEIMQALSALLGAVAAALVVAYHIRRIIKDKGEPK